MSGGGNSRRGGGARRRAQARYCGRTLMSTTSASAQARGAASGILPADDRHEGRAAREDVAAGFGAYARERLFERARGRHTHVAHVLVGEVRDELDAEALGLRQERPGGLAVDLVGVAQARFESARIRRVEPLEEVRAAEAVG